MQVWTLADTLGGGERDAANDWRHPDRIRTEPGNAAINGAKLAYRFPPLSLTVLEMQRKAAAPPSEEVSSRDVPLTEPCKTGCLLLALFHFDLPSA